jgi:FtsH-binding integral membrane protein
VVLEAKLDRGRGAVATALVQQGTLRVGDPFIVENARRLQAIAWSVLAGEGLRLVVVAIAAAVTTPSHPVNLGVRFSFAPWLAVLMLFVLAGVFAHGARMREDLAGTV